ncbi:MAG: hypothetical protein LBQ71_15395 [Hungatella sp.]|jgi:hypothetical protein|nr:hypothetical protein [Hungatella sp.]
MPERYIMVSIHNLDISERTRNALIRFGILTLNELLEKKDMDFFEIRNIGADSIQEIYSIIDHADEIFDQYETRKQRINKMVEEAGHVSVDELKFGIRAKHALHIAGIHTIADMLQMSSMDIMNLHNIGATTRDEVAVTVERLITEGHHYIDKRQTVALGYGALEEDGDEQLVEKGFDFITIDMLIERFAFKTVRMTDWFGLSRQGIYNVIEKRNPKRRDTWIGKELSESEREILIGIINEKCFNYSDDTVTCCCMNNRQNDFVCLFIYENEIKCFFLADLPEDIQEQIIAVSMHRFTDRELSGGHEGDVISVLNVKYFCPNDLTVFRSLASFRGMSADEYAMFLYGYPYIASRNVTDERISVFFEENMVEGKVYISSDPKNQWIRSYASRNGYGIKEFIEFFGYESKMDGTELTSDAARERHIEELKQCIVKDNIVYLPTDSHIYKVLQTYTYNKGTTVNKYLKSLGFERTLEKPDIVADILETDMQVYNDDGKFEEKVFAFYPLIGSKIIKQEILDKLNENARKYIDMVLREPWTKLTLRAEMQITLALINNAKTWKNEENSNFWNYTSLQFGYRDTNGAIVRLLQSSLEDAMKKNRRLFIEDSNGRAFKSTAVIHALSTKKSWMALFDFLFDFYKNNLNWKAIPGDPLMELMVEALQKKLIYDNSDADSELTISSRVYSFQEGIRKLILMRPVYTCGLFEKLIAKIDALINSTEMPVKTYEEQLCEEWFKEKITTIANTKRTERQVNVQKDVALDYSRIRAKYILKNENEVQIGLPDIRFRSENISRAMLSIYYNGRLATQQNMSWYGNELGKTLNGTSMTLPELPRDCNSLMISMKITCDGQDIYDSEETLFRSVFVFSGGSEVIVNQMKKGHYTVVMAKSVDFKIENADITEIDGFKNDGFKSYFVECQDGYLLSVDGKLVSFDSEGVMDIRIISPTESMELPGIEIEGEEYQLAYRNSACSVILGAANFLQQFIILKNGERLEFKDLPEFENNNGLAFICSLTDTGSEDICRIQIVNIGNERLIFDRKFLLISSAKCSFDREYYYSLADYEDALLTIKIDDYEEAVPFSWEDDEIRVPFRNGELHITVPKIHVEEISGDWLNSSAPAWYIGDIPQTSLLKVSAPNKIGIRFLVGGKDVMYDGQGIVTIGNVLQSFCSVGGMSLAEIEMSVHGRSQNSKYLLARVFYKERFFTKPEFWTEKSKLFWNHGGTFIGRDGRTFTLDLLGEGDTPLSVQFDEKTEYIEIPEDMEIGVYRYNISIIAGGMFKHTKEVIAEGDCIIGDQNLLRFKDRQIVIESLTDEFNEEVGHIPIRVCYIDNLKFMCMQDTSEGYCPVYSGVIFTTGYRGERYEFSFDVHTNHKGITKMMVNPVRIVYVNNTSLCIADSDGDGLYYYHYYDKSMETRVYALTDHEYTKQNRRNYSNADLYSYRTERIKDV